VQLNYSGEHLLKKVTSSAEKVIYTKYGHEAAAASTRALTAGSQVVVVVTRWVNAHNLETEKKTEKMLMGEGPLVARGAYLAY